MHIHLDPLGGIAGDMFIAAMSNAFPGLRERIEQVIGAAKFQDIRIEFSDKNDGVLTGLAFRVHKLGAASHRAVHSHGPDHLHGQDHSLGHDHSHGPDYLHGHNHSHGPEHSHGHDNSLADEHEQQAERTPHDYPTRDFPHLHEPEQANHHSHADHEHGHLHGHDHSHIEKADSKAYKDEYAEALGHGHEHRTYNEIKAIINAAELPERVREHSLNIFKIIGEAEAQVHGVDLGTIAFHEVGGWDSVVDVIGAACVLDYLHGATWSYSALPKGGGFINTAHGKLPVPPPAVALLLRGFTFRDDGVLGERVTPTGAAIIKYLQPTMQLPSNLELREVGNGFGTKRFPGFSNVLRVLTFDAVPSEQQPIGVINFEIDDMTAEEISIALDNLREVDGILDIIQTVAYGKKNRIMTSVQVLTRVDATVGASKFVLNNTTTLGVRHQIVNRTILQRKISPVQIGENKVRVKVADRPNGNRTAKVEMDDLSTSASGCHDMRKLAHAAETNVLKATNDEHN